MRAAGAAPQRAALAPEQIRAASAGQKAMMPVGRPFLDYVLAALVDAGITRVCVVCAPGDVEMRAHYAALQPERLTLEFVVQAEPRGTAHAVLAAREAVGTQQFIVLNGDNLYASEDVETLCLAGAPALVAYDAECLVAESNIPAERIRAFALIQESEDGYLTGIIEKPDDDTLRSLGQPALISMNLWAFPPAIFDACARVRPSVRGELELADAVRALVRERGEQFRVLVSGRGVLDLSSRGDIPAVAARVAGMTVRL
jgi:dTDP-glucose pyrophosphorylase